MINTALQFTQDVLNQFLKNRYGLDENKVLLNVLIEGSGSLPEKNQNKVVISLINIEKENLKPFYVHNQKLPNGNYSDITPSERFNLDILVSANFDDYNESLKFLEAVILFFQVHTVLDPASYSTFPEGLSKLEYAIEKLGYLQMHNLWTAMGAKYQPSVVYKLRLITIQGNEAIGVIPAVSDSGNEAKQK